MTTSPHALASGAPAAPAKNPNILKRIWLNKKARVASIIIGTTGAIGIGIPIAVSTINAHTDQTNAGNFKEKIERIEQFMATPEAQQMKKLSPAGYTEIQSMLEKMKTASSAPGEAVENADKALRTAQELTSDTNDIQTFRGLAEDLKAQLEGTQVSLMQDVVDDLHIAAEKFLTYANEHPENRSRGGWRTLKVWESNIMNDGLLQNLNQKLGTDYSASDVDKMIKNVETLKDVDVKAIDSAIDILIKSLKTQKFPITINGKERNNHREFIQGLTESLNGAQSSEIGIYSEGLLKLILVLVLIYSAKKKYFPAVVPPTPPGATPATPPKGLIRTAISGHVGNLRNAISKRIVPADVLTHRNHVVTEVTAIQAKLPAMLTEARQELTTMTRHITAAHGKIRGWKKERDDLSIEKTDCDNEIAALRTRIQNAKIPVTSEITHISNDISAKEARLADFELQLSNLQNPQKGWFGTRKPDKDSISLLTNRIATLETTISTLKRDRSVLTQKENTPPTDLATELTKLENQNKTRAKTILDLTRKITSMEHNIDETSAPQGQFIQDRATATAHVAAIETFIHTIPGEMSALKKLNTKAEIDTAEHDISHNFSGLESTLANIKNQNVLLASLIA